MERREPKGENGDGQCLIDFIQGLYDRPVSSLTDAEMQRLQDSFIGSEYSGSAFGCTEDGCRSVHRLRVEDGKLVPGDMILHMDAWPCMYEPETQ